MSHAATISSLTNGLINAISGLNPEKDARRFKLCKDAATRAFRSQQYARVNQFDVQARLDGLEEKFAVLNRESVADALHNRREELTKQSTRWTPEILSLLLSLSDRPVEKTNLSILDEQDVDDEESPQLTWADILAEDPLNEEGIWDDVVIDSDNSDDEFQALRDDTIDDRTVSTEASSLAEEDVAAFARSFIVVKDSSELEAFESATPNPGFPISSADLESRPRKISDLQATREALLMLRGLPTTLFTIDSVHKYRLRSDFHGATCNTSTFRTVMQSFADHGSQVLYLRRWSKEVPKGDLLQRLNATIVLKLEEFDKDLAQLEHRFLSSQTDVTVSLQEVLLQVQDRTKSIQYLATTVETAESCVEVWSVLDTLYDMTCELQFGEDSSVFYYVASVFFDCLDIYLRPVYLWMTQGKLHPQNKGFFVRACHEVVDPGSLWHSHFEILTDTDGNAKAPTVMHDAARQIFISGKSTMFLDAIRYGKQNNSFDHIQMRGLDSQRIISSLEEGLLPFTCVFAEALQAWIGDLQSHSMDNLRELMFTRCGLSGTIAVIGNAYLALDGARVQHFADRLFSRIDRKRPWADRYILTDLARNTLGTANHLDPQRLSVKMISRGSPTRPHAAVAAIAADLDCLLVDYVVPWPLKNIIRDMTVCQRALLTSIRVYRSEYLLQKQQWTMLTIKDHRNRRLQEALVLRQRLIWFTYTVRSHMADIAAAAAHELRVDMEKAVDLDGMVLAYDGFQDRVEARLLLRANMKPIYRALVDILEICEDFAVIWSHLVEEANHNIFDGARTQRTSVAPEPEHSDDSAEEMEEDLQVNFGHIRDLSTLTREYNRQLHFAIAGLRGVSRAGGESSWISLAEKLNLGAEYMNKG
ncbi:hypothetical protein AAFC00_003308 [Neodothiora populina]|uniref:Spindle pole body component n=1 Tax=Neodothiora populina TaxID=2781224 RepID=A0ABR3PAB0_9PEZI